jgi:hypothetical protein
VNVCLGILTDDPAFLPACCLVACNWQLLGRSVLLSGTFKNVTEV